MPDLQGAETDRGFSAAKQWPRALFDLQSLPGETDMTMKCMMCGKQKPEDEMMRGGPKNTLQPVCSDCMGKANKQMDEAMTSKDES